MKISISHVAESSDSDFVFSRCRFDKTDHFSQPTSWNGGIFEDRRGRDASQSAERSATGRGEPRGFFVIASHFDGYGSMFLCDLSHCRSFVFHNGGMAMRFHEEQSLCI